MTIEDRCVAVQFEADLVPDRLELVAVGRQSGKRRRSFAGSRWPCSCWSLPDQCGCW